MYQPLTYVVISNWNGKKTLQTCLVSFFAKTNTSQCRVVVVDNASVDGSIGMIRESFPTVEVIGNSSNVGFSIATNQGIRQALSRGADFVLLLNNDVVITDGKWLEKLKSVLQSDTNIGIVGCKLFYPDGKIQHAGGVMNIRGGYNRGECKPDTGQYDKLEFLDFVTGAVLLIRSNVIRQIGLLDEGFSPLYYEDTDWCVRARLHGYKIAYTPNPTFIHNCGSSANKLALQRKLFYLRRSFIRFFLLNFKPADIAKRLLLYETQILLGCFIHRNRNKKSVLTLRSDASTRFTFFLKAWWPSLRNIKQILTLRRQRFSLQKTNEN